MSLKPNHRIEAIFNNAGALLTNGHYVYTSGRHAATYINKDAIYTNPAAVSTLCQQIVRHFYKAGVEYDVVVGPEKGGIILAQWTAYHASRVYKDRTIAAIYAERSEQALFKASEANTSFMGMDLNLDDEVVIKRPQLVLKRGYDKLVTGRNILVVEDNLTTGGTVKKVIETVRALRGTVVAVGTLTNGGNVKAHDIGNVPELFSVFDIKAESWLETECPLCVQGKPISIEAGKGREFLSHKK